MYEPFQFKLSRPRLIDGNGTQDNNKKRTRRQELELFGDSEYKMPKTGVEPEWFIQRWLVLIYYCQGYASSPLSRHA